MIKGNEVTELTEKVSLSSITPGKWEVTIRETDNGNYAGFDVCSQDKDLRVAIIPDGQMPHQRANARIISKAPAMHKMLCRIEAAMQADNIGIPRKWQEDLTQLLNSV